MEEIKKIEDMDYFELLAWLGIGSSHPGGFQSTKQNLDSMQINSQQYVLDAGCGSGLTACYLAKKTGAGIIGIDINPQMIEKARLRAEHEKVSHLVEFKTADIYSLPFPDNFFDWVITESVTIFLDRLKVFHEFYRVLKPQGQVADLEMALLKELPAEVRKQLEECFGPDTNPLPFAEWSCTLSQAGFQDVGIKNPRPLSVGFLGVKGISKIKEDWLLFKDLEDKIKNHPGILLRLKKNADFIKKNKSYFGFGLLYGCKRVNSKMP